MSINKKNDFKFSYELPVRVAFLKIKINFSDCLHKKI